MSGFCDFFDMLELLLIPDKQRRYNVADILADIYSA